MSKARWFLLGVLSLLAVAASAVAIFLTQAHGFSARSEPSTLETFVASNAREVAMPTNYRKLHNPLPASPGNIQAGMEHFADHCATCHGNDGGGDTLFGKGLYPKPPDLRKPETQNKSDGELYFFIQNGVRLSGMPAFGEHAGAGEVESWHLVVFIRHLPTLTSEELEKMESLNPKTESERREEREEEEFLRGGNPSDK